jgi:RHS repeat-associated protein
VDHSFGFTGRERDQETGLNYHRLRYFDGNVGAWLNQDPIGFRAGDTNLQRYVRNRVTTSTDPSGLAPPSIFSTYVYYLTDPGEMDTELEVGFYVAGTTGAVAGVAAGGIVVVGAYSGTVVTAGGVTLVGTGGTVTSAGGTVIGAGSGGLSGAVVAGLSGENPVSGAVVGTTTGAAGGLSGQMFTGSSLGSALAGGGFSGTIEGGLDAALNGQNIVAGAGSGLVIGTLTAGTFHECGGLLGDILSTRPKPILTPSGGQLQRGCTLYRVCGGAADEFGVSWTTVDPTVVPLYRPGAGLFPGNTGETVVVGTLIDLDDVVVRPAMPGPTTPSGVLMVPDVIVPHPVLQIKPQTTFNVDPSF